MKEGDKMAIYYKGTIRLSKDLTENKYILSYPNITGSTLEVFPGFTKTTSDEDDKLIMFLKEVTMVVDKKTLITDEEIKHILNKLFNSRHIFDFDKNCFISYQIIFKLVENENGEIFGKELKTGYMFPIYSQDKLENEYYYKIVKPNPASFRIEVIDIAQLKYDCLAKSAAFIFNYEIADNNEVKAYQRSNQPSRSSEIVELFNKNVFFTPFKEKEKQEVISSSPEMISMENIELLLIKLKEIDEELYNKYNSKYQSLIRLINDKETVMSADVTELFELEKELNFIVYLTKNKDGKRLIDLYAQNESNNIFKNESNQTLPLDSVLYLNYIFLIFKDKLNLHEQREIIKSISFLYLLKMINMKNEEETIVISEYISNNKNNIIILINELMESGLIDKIDIEPNISDEELINIIQNIKIRNDENNLVLKR